MERQVLNGFLANVTASPPLIVAFRFNPESVSDSKAVQFSDRSSELCGNAPGKVYTGGGDRTISFDLTLHGLEQGGDPVNPTGLENGVASELARLRSFMYPKDDAWTAMASAGSGRRLQPPPTCTFGFGAKVLDCVVTQLTVTETQFNSFLTPVRADANVTLVVIEDPANALHELDRHRRNALSLRGMQNLPAF